MSDDSDDNVNDSRNRPEKMIKLRSLKPNEYRLWVMQTKAAFEIHECLDIVLGKEPNPTPINEETGTPLGPWGSAMQRKIDSWKIRHAYAREALLRSLEASDLLKVTAVEDSAAGIWTRLKDEYGRSLDFEYIRVNNEYQSLRKDKKISMNDHINRFNKLLQEVEYNKPSEIPKQDPAAINLQFLASLGSDWEVWGMAKGDNLRKIPTAQLMAEVRALSASRSSISNSSDASTMNQDQTSDAAKALTLRMKNGNRGNRGGGGNRGNWHPYNNRDNRNHDYESYQGGNRGRGRGRGYRGNNGDRKGKKRKSSFDPNKHCTRCQRIGHDIWECRTFADEQKNMNSGSDDKGNGGNNGKQSRFRSDSYQPNLSQPYPHCSYPYSANTINHIVKVTRFVANSSAVNSSMANSEITDSFHTKDWLIDSAANAYITPYKNDLRFYIEEDIGEIKGFGGAVTRALGKGSMTLTDVTGNRLILHNVCYVSESQDRILSLMKFRREHSADFRFTGSETFTIMAANGFQVSGKSINDILHISLSPQSEINAVATRQAIKRKQETEETEEVTETESSDMEMDEVSETSLSCTPSNLWHLRYGHPSSTTLRKLKRIKSNFDSSKCVPCLRGKKTRKPFARSTSKATDKLTRVHTDICGQFPESKGNSIYNLIFLDEFTHWAHSVPIPDKSSETVKESFMKWIVQAERETGCKIKNLRSDGGGEYQGALTPVLESLGIKHEKTPADTPELNGKAERLNRTLNSSVRTMLIQANMPHSFWAEAMTTATYLRNRLPSSAIDDEIPFEC